MNRRVSWFSCGAASAVATKLSRPDVIAYCETGAEDKDNKRFMVDCVDWFDQEIVKIKSEKYESTWDLWEKRSYLSGVAGAPCTGELKVAPRLLFQRKDDVHIFGYTSDASDIRRAKILRGNWPEIKVETPLIDRGISKAACLAMLKCFNIAPPRVYALGFPNANCIPCVKAASPSYWALIRKHYPAEFDRMTELSRRLGVRLVKETSGKRNRLFVDEVPLDQPTNQPIAPECDFLCSLSVEDIENE